MHHQWVSVRVIFYIFLGENGIRVLVNVVERRSCDAIRLPTADRTYLCACASSCWDVRVFFFRNASVAEGSRWCADAWRKVIVCLLITCWRWCSTGCVTCKRANGRLTREFLILTLYHSSHWKLPISEHLSLLFAWFSPTSDEHGRDGWGGWQTRHLIHPLSIRVASDRSVAIFVSDCPSNLSFTHSHQNQTNEQTATTTCQGIVHKWRCILGGRGRSWNCYKPCINTLRGGRRLLKIY